MTTSDQDTLRDLESRRCAALMGADEAVLAGLLTEDLVHIHLNGHVDDKPGYLAGFRDKYIFRNIERGELTIRIFGDAAVMTGPLIQTIVVRDSGQVIDVRAITTQVWSRDGDGWRLNTCHNAPVAA
ncbi:nuclear transport factor 2 family protein [Paracoccus siganidrum]|nr:nuclear transport factor 2 family protein [Paracoccus siganidrum]